MLEIKVLEQKIETVTQFDHTRGTVGAKVRVIFDSFWSDYKKTLVFERCYGSVVDEPVKVFVNGMDVTIDIPPEILAECGQYKIGAFGVKEGVVLPTLYSEKFDSLYSTNSKGGKTPYAYIPSEIDQLRLSKQNKLTADDNITIDENNVISARCGGEGGGATDYELFDNLPHINGAQLVGDITADEGMYLTNGETYGKTVVLPESANTNDCYEIIEQENEQAIAQQEG